VGHWIDGVCTGEVEEFDRSGKLTWKGSYLDGVRHGFGIQYFPEGSRIEGTWKNGILDGNGVFYFYPDNSYLHGIWKRMVLWFLQYFEVPSIVLRIQILKVSFTSHFVAEK